MHDDLCCWNLSANWYQLAGKTHPDRWWSLKVHKAFECGLCTSSGHLRKIRIGFMAQPCANNSQATIAYRPHRRWERLNCFCIWLERMPFIQFWLYGTYACNFASKLHQQTHSAKSMQQAKHALHMEQECLHEIPAEVRTGKLIVPSNRKDYKWGRCEVSRHLA